jgi:hypothetical protein
MPERCSLHRVSSPFSGSFQGFFLFFFLFFFFLFLFFFLVRELCVVSKSSLFVGLMRLAPQGHALRAADGSEHTDDKEQNG